jgi:hypothetical protein
MVDQGSCSSFLRLSLQAWSDSRFSCSFTSYRSGRHQSKSRASGPERGRACVSCRIEACRWLPRISSAGVCTTWSPPERPDPSQVAVAPSYHGPWRMLNDPHPGDPTCSSCQSQGQLRLPAPAQAGPLHPVGRPVAASLHRVKRGRDRNARPAVQPLWRSPGRPLVRADRDRHIDRRLFLAALRFEPERALLDWHDEWRIEDYS